jgi:hypothetical protein
MLMHRVIISVRDNGDLANQDEQELGMAHKAFRFPSVAMQAGGEAHTRSEEGKALGWAVSPSPKKSVCECQLRAHATFDSDMCVLQVLIDIFGKNNEACSFDTLDVCVNPARKEDSHSWAGLQQAEERQIRQEKAAPRILQIALPPARLMHQAPTARSSISLQADQANQPEGLIDRADQPAGLVDQARSSISLQADRPVGLIDPVDPWLGPFLSDLANAEIMPGIIANFCSTCSFSSTLSDPFSRQNKTGHVALTA